MGAGDCFEELRALCTELRLDDWVRFTGRVPDDAVFTALSTADVGLSPDPKNPLNDVSTMNKTMEYMSFELPVVAFDLRETRVSAGEAAIYATPNDVDAYAAAIVELLEDESLRHSMGALGRARVEAELAWRHQRDHYVGVYDTLVHGGVRAEAAEPAEVELLGRSRHPLGQPAGQVAADSPPRKD
jgi:asparagine synthase (glutamine-hydrolysing)